MDKILEKLKIDETYSKPVKKPKVFDKVKDNIPHAKGYNYMSDLLFLPTDKRGYKYCLVVVDLASDNFDIEPLKDKESSTVLQGLKNIFKREYIKKPKGSIRTDNGSEFQGVFHKYLYDNNILHSYALPDRHTQLANVERLNRELGRLFNGYMNAMEINTKKQYTNWADSDVLDIIREDLNELREKPMPKHIADVIHPAPTIQGMKKLLKPIFRVGNIVYRKLDHPQNFLGHKQSTNKFREGDLRWEIHVPRKITKILIYNNGPRYVLSGLNNVSFTADQLEPAKEKEERYIVEKIVDKRTRNKKIEYLVKWKGYNNSENTWEPIQNLKDDDLSDMIEEFEKNKKKKN